MNSSRKARHQFYLRLIVAFIVTFDVAFLWQKLSGAHESEFGAHPDEAAHYVTGLFVHDAIATGGHYVAGGFQGSPVKIGSAFAKDFYEHYPKVALGVWPPAFYVVQSAWTFPFGASRMSIMVLIAVLAGLVAMLLFEATYRAFGKWPAVLAAVLWLCAPLARELYGMVMAETLSTLFIFSATLVWGRYLDERRKWDALWFALLASAAIMTKGTGVALVLMCGLSILFRRAWSIFKRPSLWAALLLIVLLAGVWTWYFRDWGSKAGGWEDTRLSWSFTKEAISFYSLEMTASLGAFALAGFALAGMIAMFRHNGRWAALTALVIGVLVFHFLIPVGRESRHLLPATPAFVLLAIAGVHVLARQDMRWTVFLAPIFGAWIFQAGARVASFLAPDWVPVRVLPYLLVVTVLAAIAIYVLVPRRLARLPDAALQQRRELQWVLFLGLLVLPFALDQPVRKIYSGFESLALQLLEKSEPGTRILVCSDASGEGMLISEIAMRDHRPNLTIERGSKTLVDPKSQSWSGRTPLKLQFGDDEDLFKYLTTGKIAFIVLDTAVPDRKSTSYHEQLKRVVEDRSHIGVFFPVGESPITRDGEDLAPPIRLYRVAPKGQSVTSPDEIAPP